MQAHLDLSRNRKPKPRSERAPGRFRMSIRTSVDPCVVGPAIAAWAKDAGLPPRAASEVALVAMELASNQVRHAGGGHIESTLADGGWEIVATDRGPGIADVPRALEDEPIPSPRGLGCGLGAVRRLVDELEIDNRAGGGLRVRARKARAG